MVSEVWKRRLKQKHCAVDGEWASLQPALRSRKRLFVGGLASRDPLTISRAATITTETSLKFWREVEVELEVEGADGLVGDKNTLASTFF